MDIRDYFVIDSSRATKAKRQKVEENGIASKSELGLDRPGLIDTPSASNKSNSAYVSRVGHWTVQVYIIQAHNPNDDFKIRLLKDHFRPCDSYNFKEDGKGKRAFRPSWL